MIASDNLFALPEIAAMLSEELRAVGMHAARRPAGRALVIQPCAANRGLSVDTRHLAAVRLHVQHKQLDGDIACAPDALPWEDDAFQMVLAQHVGDVLSPEAGIVVELARVLAPGGVLLWYGLNPWSPWQVWVHWRRGRGMALQQARHAESMRRYMASRHLAVAKTHYLGAFWPQLDAVSNQYAVRLPRPLQRAYVLTAAKQRDVLTPLRPRLLRARVMTHPQLASTPSRRARA